MKRTTLAITALLFISFQAVAHSGRTDSSGGHNCSAKSVQKGLCSGYHYHNNGGSHLDITKDVVSEIETRREDETVRAAEHDEQKVALPAKLDV